jgi:pyruvate dehydrogenase E2 component (dihydrolipoamide acetyltransferase)
MPKMSMTMTEGVFLTWHKSPGDEVREGEVVCEVATDKVDMEVEATVAGTLTRLLASPEDVVPVGEPIAYVAAESDELLEGLFDAPDPPSPTPNGSPAAVPAARRLATERGVDLATITPTGPWDTIRLSDVDTGRRAGNGRTAIARRMAASAQIPQFVLYRDLDLETVDRTHGWTVLLTHAFAAALRRHPALNASWADGVTHHEHVGVALAVDTDRGLLAPVLTDPDLDTLDALGTRIADLVGRARTGRLDLAELTAPATATVSNLGGLGVTGFHAVLTPPQATALAVGAVEPKAVPVPGGVGVRLRCTVGLTVDHRVADGAEAARLLGTLQELL